jgi:acetylornithine deacetylase/succinyl-diaminopimelate desuccinylase-like protein
LDRDIILLAEADKEARSTGIKWIALNAFGKVDAEFALDEFGYWRLFSSRHRVFHMQTAEKVPTQIKLTARGTAGHGSLPRSDNPVSRLSKAIVRLIETRAYIKQGAAKRVRKAVRAFS